MATPQPQRSAQDAAPSAPTVLTVSNGSHETSLPQRTPPHRPLYPHQSPSLTDASLKSNASHGPAQQQQHQQQAQQPPSQSQQRSVKRPRPVKSCTECRKRKLRCDRLCPCSQCQKSNRACRYAVDHDSANLSEGSDSEMMETGRPVKRPAIANAANVESPGIMASATTTTTTAGKNGDAAGQAGLDDLAMRMERLEKHIKHQRTAKRNAEGAGLVAASPNTQRGLSVKDGGRRTRYFGQNEPRVLLNLFDDAREILNESHKYPSIRPVLRHFHSLHEILQEDYRKALTPITVFVDSMMPVQKRMMDILPKKAVCDRLVAAYISTSESLYRFIHIPTFMEQYTLYWEGKLHVDYFLPQLLAILSVASRFETKSKGLGYERVEGVHIPTACALVRTWLDGLKGKQLVDLTTLQVELLLSYATRMITRRWQDNWISLGSIVRLAMTMGLQRDPSEYGQRMSVFCGEIRRRLWYTVLDMDLHISMACNLPCTLRDGDFTTRSPRNLDDSELFPGMQELPVSKPIDKLTDTQLQVYAAMTLGLRMKVSHLVNRSDAYRDPREVAELGVKLEQYLEDINYIFPRHGIHNESQKSRLWRCRVILDMVVRRALLALYRPFALGVPDALPQVSRPYLRSSMVILKYLDELDPMMAHFEDIVDMYHQVLKHDIVQSAFGVCSFIRQAIRGQADNSTAGGSDAGSPRMSHESADAFPSYVPESLIPWSPSRLVATVDKSMDSLLDNVGGRDIKTLVCLVMVLETSKMVEVNEEAIAQALRGVLDRCLRSTNISFDRLTASKPTHAHAHVPGQGPVGGNARAGPYLSDASMPSLGYADPLQGSGMPEDFAEWIMWAGWEDLVP